MQPEVIFGNAQLDGCDRRGWFMGHFIDPSQGARSTSDLELKWGVHSAGEKRTEWGVNPHSTTISILLEGRFRLQFSSQEVILAQPGDYALWLPGVGHTWCAEEDSKILTVRYPSVPN
ncbi:MAG TPA: hypothetical protein V6D06_01085 [Trichocoleus sp.]